MNDSNPFSPNARLRAIYASVVSKLKEVVREYKITQEELHIAGDFLDRLGKAGFSRSLVDVALAMTSVDATARVASGTRPNLEGPFHKSNAPSRKDGNLFEAAPPPGSPTLTLTGLVVDSQSGQPLPAVTLDVWQADHEGHYDLQGHHLSGRVSTDENGHYRVETAVPKDYSDHDSDPIGELFRAMSQHNRRAAHIHIKVIRDLECVLTTQLFIRGNPYLDSDYVEGAVSDDLIINTHAVVGRPNHFEARFDFAVTKGTRSR
jgi:protocatechuate 3,4-dioxygenase beta subunit